MYRAFPWVMCEYAPGGREGKCRRDKFSGREKEAV